MENKSEEELCAQNVIPRNKRSFDTAPIILVLGLPISMRVTFAPSYWDANSTLHYGYELGYRPAILGNIVQKTIKKCFPFEHFGRQAPSFFIFLFFCLI